MSTNIDDALTQIKKDRYLISCKCTLCNDTFKDIIFGSQHVYKKHPKREVKNVIENLSWDLQSDMRKWDILEDLKAKRDMIINKLADQTAINKAEIPSIVTIQRKKVDISDLVKNLETDSSKSEESPETEEEDYEEEELDARDFENSNSGEGTAVQPEENTGKNTQNNSKKSDDFKKGKKRNLTDLLDRELEKYTDSIKRLLMASEVEQVQKSRKKGQTKLDKYIEELDYFLGVSKAIGILKTNKIDLEIIL